MSVDLHLHTHYSDGTWTPQGLVDRAVALGLTCIAITDHDTVDGIEESVKAAGDRIRIVPGIEINTVWETGTGRRKDVHVLGYFIEPGAASINELIARQRRARVTQMEETISRLQANGIAITMEDVRAVAGEGSVGRPHLAKALMKIGAVKTAHKAYSLLMKQSSPFYVPRRSVGPQEAIKAIRDAGGFSSLAHPGKDKELPELFPVLLEAGLDGIEVYYRSHSSRLVKRYEKLAGEHGLLMTGGSDCHGPYENYPPCIGTVAVPPKVVQAMDALRAK
ncbi:MAG: PHP domain-containing protein [Candidatus Obscuribacterales bacterium]|nr:PHP domain-containing protein [Candidatus Obscuribacterales bacterium]